MKSYSTGIHITVMPLSTRPMGTAFTYQGRLIDANSAADGLYDFQFKLFDANTAGAQQGDTVDLNEVDVIDGYFTVELDFGDMFNGDARWLETGVRPGELEDPNVYTVLTPRTELTPTPYALQTRGIFVDNDCNVGIGTTSPSAKLHIEGGDVQIGDDTKKMILFTSGIGEDIASTNTLYLNYGNNQPVSIGGGGTSDLYVSGNVGIGTESPRSSLDTLWGISTGSMLGNTPGTVTFFPADGHAWFHIDNGPAGGRPTGRLRISHGDNPGDHELISILQNGNVGIGTTSPQERLHITDTYVAMDLESTTPNQKWRITVPSTGNLHFHDITGAPATSNVLVLENSTKNVGIGTQTPASRLHVKSDGIGISDGITLEKGNATNYWTTNIWSGGGTDNHLFFAYNGTWRRRFSSTDGTASTNSDIKLKTHIKPIRYGLDTIMELNPVMYKMKSDPQGAETMGLIAQETEKVIPEIVSEMGGSKGIAYTKILPILIKSTQEQQSQIEELKAQNAAQQKAIAALEQLHNRVEVLQEKEAEIAELKERLTAMEGLVAGLSRRQEGGRL